VKHHSHLFEWKPIFYASEFIFTDFIENLLQLHWNCIDGYNKFIVCANSAEEFQRYKASISEFITVFLVIVGSIRFDFLLLRHGRFLSWPFLRCWNVILYFGQNCGFPFVERNNFVELKAELAEVYHSFEKSVRSLSFKLLIRAAQNLCWRVW
jgi:hypothetical protein